MDRNTEFISLIEELNKPRTVRKGLIQNRKNPFSISDSRINELYDRYFTNLSLKDKSFSFIANTEDFEEIIYLMRIHFRLWIEIEGLRIKIFREFPERFRVISEVNSTNHWFIPKTYPKGTILYYGDDPYSVCNRDKGIPLSEESPKDNSSRLCPIVQINYEFIEVLGD
jgi:hypothetical protein